MTAIISRPNPDEYAPYYANYIRRVPEGNIVEILAHQIDQTQPLLRGLSEAQAGFRFAPAEWSIKEVVGHLIDCERVFAHRALSISRQDPAPLPNFEQDDYVRAAHFDQRSLADLTQEFELLRRANVLAFKYLSSEASQQRGLVNGLTCSVRALLYIMAGHELHHLESFQTDYLAVWSS